MELTTNPQAILPADFELAKATILGLKIGDLAADIPKEILSESTLRDWVHTNRGIAFGIDLGNTGRIIGCYLKEEVVSQMGVSSPQQLTSLFGAPAGEEKQFGRIYRFYPERKMVVIWNVRDDKFDGIQLGEGIVKQTIYSAIDLLNTYLEQRGHVSSEKDWLEQARRWGDSGSLRLQELGALMEAFGFGSNLKLLGSGEFLKKRSLTELKPLLEDMDRYAQEFQDKVDFMKSITLDEIGGFHIRPTRIYAEYLRLIREVHKIAAFNSGYLEAGSLTSRYIIRRTGAVIGTIDFKKLDEIKAMLAQLIDPQQRTFTKSQLIRDYRFPDVDIREIEMDEY